MVIGPCWANMCRFGRFWTVLKEFLPRITYHWWRCRYSKITRWFCWNLIIAVLSPIWQRHWFLHLWSPKTLKTIISSIVIVPILVLTTTKTQTKLDFFANLAFNGWNVQIKWEFVRKTVTGPFYIGPLSVWICCPIVQCVFNTNSFVKIQIHYTNSSFHCVKIWHPGTFQFDFLITQKGEKVWIATGLGKKWWKRWAGFGHSWAGWWGANGTRCFCRCVNLKIKESIKNNYNWSKLQFHFL